MFKKSAPPKDRRVRRNYTLRNVNTLSAIDRMGVVLDDDPSFSDRVERTSNIWQGAEQQTEEVRIFHIESNPLDFQYQRTRTWETQSSTLNMEPVAQTDEYNPSLLQGQMAPNHTDFHTFTEQQMNRLGFYNVFQDPRTPAVNSSIYAQQSVSTSDVYSQGSTDQDWTSNQFYPKSQMSLFDSTTPPATQQQHEPHRQPLSNPSFGDHGNTKYQDELPTTPTPYQHQIPEQKKRHPVKSSIFLPAQSAQFSADKGLYPLEPIHPPRDDRIHKTNDNLSFEEIAESLADDRLYEHIPSAPIYASDTTLDSKLKSDFLVEQLIPPFPNKRSSNSQDKLIYSYIILYRSVIIGIGAASYLKLAQQRSAYNAFNYCGCFDAEHERNELLDSNTGSFFELSSERINVLHRMILNNIKIGWVNKFLWSVNPLDCFKRQLDLATIANGHWNSQLYLIDERSDGILFGLSNETVYARYSNKDYIGCLQEVRWKFGDRGSFVRILPDIFKNKILTITYIFTYEVEKGRSIIIGVGSGRDSEEALMRCALGVIHASPVIINIEGPQSLKSWEIFKGDAGMFYPALKNMVEITVRYFLDRRTTRFAFDRFDVSMIETFEKAGHTKGIVQPQKKSEANTIKLPEQQQQKEQDDHYETTPAEPQTHQSSTNISELAKYYNTPEHPFLILQNTSNMSDLSSELTPDLTGMLFQEMSSQPVIHQSLLELANDHLYLPLLQIDNKSLDLRTQLLKVNAKFQDTLNSVKLISHPVAVAGSSDIFVCCLFLNGVMISVGSSLTNEMEANLRALLNSLRVSDFFKNQFIHPDVSHIYEGLSSERLKFVIDRHLSDLAAKSYLTDHDFQSYIVPNVASFEGLVIPFNQRTYKDTRIEPIQLFQSLAMLRKNERIINSKLGQLDSQISETFHYMSKPQLSKMFEESKKLFKKELPNAKLGSLITYFHIKTQRYYSGVAFLNGVMVGIGVSQKNIAECISQACFNAIHTSGVFGEFPSYDINGVDVAIKGDSMSGIKGDMRWRFERLVDNQIDALKRQSFHNPHFSGKQRANF
ncbi:hypothetical protein WICPIJ_003436 [Wickerhamomyces pijperi]|uniref:Uncharacterized protein n=1 Tax=Wickerhamomyces pijperi TaxID=599730 RepID=A0A9P8TNQ1_WICPI|nr:hypothetical protein WICPIJ_003436 [Wickerhamomyces pijperi]